MNYTDVVKQIEFMCGKVIPLKNGWHQFVYHQIVFICMSDFQNGYVRITIPHLINSKDYQKGIIETTVNEINKEVKYIKAIIWENGSISLKYDYKFIDVENVAKVVEHMIETLYKASEYFLKKLQFQTL